MLLTAFKGFTRKKLLNTFRRPNYYKYDQSVCLSNLPWKSWLHANRHNTLFSPQTTYGNLKGLPGKHAHHFQRQRIPSKEHPPPGLAEWLKQFQVRPLTCVQGDLIRICSLLLDIWSFISKKGDVRPHQNPSLIVGN